VNADWFEKTKEQVLLESPAWFENKLKEQVLGVKAGRLLCAND
jgi:hypothetical protein